MTFFRKKYYSRKPDSKSFRVRSPVKSFRDLDVYKNTTQLAADIFSLKVPEKYRKNEKLKREMEKLRLLSGHIPRLVAESFGDKFTNRPLAFAKLEKSSQLVSNLIAKIDFLSAVVDEAGFREAVLGILKKYQVSRRKILNLKKAWERIGAKR